MDPFIFSHMNISETNVFTSLEISGVPDNSDREKNTIPYYFISKNNSR